MQITIAGYTYYICWNFHFYSRMYIKLNQKFEKLQENLLHEEQKCNNGRLQMNNWTHPTNSQLSKQNINN